MNIIWINCFVKLTNEIQAYKVARRKVTVIFSINIIPFSLMFPHYSDGWFKLKLISWFSFKYQHLLNVNMKQTKCTKIYLMNHICILDVVKYHASIFSSMLKIRLCIFNFKFQPQYSKQNLLVQPKNNISSPVSGLHLWLTSLL